MDAIREQLARQVSELTERNAELLAALESAHDIFRHLPMGTEDSLQYELVSRGCDETGAALAKGGANG